MQALILATGASRKIHRFTETIATEIPWERENMITNKQFILVKKM